MHFNNQKINSSLEKNNMQDEFIAKNMLNFKSNRKNSLFRQEEEEGSKHVELSSLLKRILEEAVQRRASDVHFEPYAGGLEVRYRIEGMLIVVLEMRVHEVLAIVSQIKFQAGCDISVRNKAQEGRLHFQWESRSIHCRVSILPTPYGESVVLRILDEKALCHNIEKNHFSIDLDYLHQEIAKLNTGLIIACGPTGSGKTSSIYGFLKQLNPQELKIMTVEDPIEYELEGVVQVNIQPQLHFGFSEAIRAFMRHDLDVLMIGEIRDSETAAHSVQAALTGHLVLSTVHAYDVCSVPIRLLDLGVEPYLIADSLDIIIAQRLLPKLCEECKDIDPDLEKEHFKAVGCEKCRFIGYSERMLVVEFLKVTDPFRDLILRNRSLLEMRAFCHQRGMIGLREKVTNAFEKGIIDALTWSSFEKDILV